MLQLIYKIGGDINPLKKSLAHAPTEAAKAGKEAGSAFGKELGAQAKGALMSFIGAGAIVGMFRQAMEQARNIAKQGEKTGLGSLETQALNRASERTGLTPDELLARGRANPAAFAKLMSGIEAQGGFLGEGQVSALVAGSEKAEGVANVGKGMAASALDFAMKYSPLAVGTRALDYMSVGMNTLAGSGAEMLGRGFGSKRMMEASRFLTTTADVGAERLVAEGFFGRGQEQSQSSKEVADAVRALHQTVAEKL